MQWYELTPELSVLVPHCPEPTQVVELRKAARQLCQDARIWSRPVQIYTVPGLASYSLDPPEPKSSIISPDWLSLNGHRLVGRNTGRHGDTPGTAVPGRPTQYYQYPGGDMIVAPVPDKQYVIEGAVALQPTRLSENCPEWLADDWGEAITALAAARLAAMPAKDWTDNATTQLQYGIYDSYMRSALQRKKAADQPGSRFVQYGGL